MMWLHNSLLAIENLGENLKTVCNKPVVILGYIGVVHIIILDVKFISDLVGFTPFASPSSHQLSAHLHCRRLAVCS